MVTLSRLGKQVQEVLASLDRIGVPCALIGGLALVPYKVKIRHCWMKSSQPYPEREPSAAPVIVFVADGGAPPAVRSDRDPFDTLDDLMTVVEALCPAWPPRESFGPMKNLRL